MQVQISLSRQSSTAAVSYTHLYYVRKAAHMTEYFLLAVAISFPLYVYGVRGIWLMILAGIVCVGFAGLDEYHQSFVDSRTPSVKDVGIDSIGAMIGVLLVQAFCWSCLLYTSSMESIKTGTYITLLYMKNNSL